MRNPGVQHEQNAPPRVAIVVLNWNRPGDTAECLASVYDLAYPNVLPLLVDNGSTDDSVERLGALFPGCTLLRNPGNLGFAEGNNVGIRHALAVGAKYVLLLNNDAKIDRDALGRLVEAAEGDPSIGVLGPKIYFWDRPHLVWSAGGKVDPVTAEPIHMEAQIEDARPGGEPGDLDYISGCALMVRAGLLRRIGLLDGDYFLVFEDTDLCARAKEAGYRVVLVPRATVWHRVSGTFGGSTSLGYLYYFHRNNWIFVHKRVRGLRRWRAYYEVLRRQLHYLWQLHRRGRPEAAEHRRVILRAAEDFVLKRWGKGG